MIDLTYTKEKMLADIKVSKAVTANCIFDAEDPRFISYNEVQLIVERQTPAELLPILNAAFEQRFAAVPSAQLFRDLIYPLKKGVGNAYKRGNCKQDGKKITVETIATRSGAVIAIADEGNGFDYANVLERFENNERYFTYRGSGFDQFQKARSVINYVHGGRVLLIRFLSKREPGRPLTSAEGASFGPAGDMAYMKAFLARELPQLQSPDASLESCRASIPDNIKKSQWHIAYMLKFRNGRTDKNHEMVMTGRVLTQPAARTEFSATRQLHQLAGADLKIPLPVAFLETPPMALFAFPPAQNLRRHLQDKSSFDDMVQLQSQIASGLETLHKSRINLERTVKVSDVLLQQRTIGQRITQKLVECNPQRADRVDKFCKTLAQQAIVQSAYELAPIHNAFGWDCILHHNDNLYFHFFEQSCYGHPGFDVGGYLADLARYYLLGKNADQTQYETLRHVFLDTYFSNNSEPWIDDLPFFIGATMLSRLERLLKRPQSKWEPKIDKLLALCERILEI